MLCIKGAEIFEMKSNIELLDTVALTQDIPQRGLRQGEVGTVVELLAPNAFEVEFSDNDGNSYAEFALAGDQLIVLHNQGRGWKVAA